MEFNHGNETVRTNLLADFGVSAMPWIEELLDKGLRVMYFKYMKRCYIKMNIEQKHICFIC